MGQMWAQKMGFLVDEGWLACQPDGLHGADDDGRPVCKRWNGAPFGEDESSLGVSITSMMMTMTI